MAQKAFRDRGVKCQTLSLGAATYENVKKYSQYNPIKYIYICAHGGFHADRGDKFPVFRTSVDLFGGERVISVKQSDFPPGEAPPWCESLEGKFEEETLTFYSMNFTNLEFAFFDCCYSGTLRINSKNELIKGQPGQEGLWDIPHSDMSIALRLDNTSTSRIYQGWYGEPILNRPDLPESEDQKWVRLEWIRLGEGDSIYDALFYVINQQTEFGPEDPVNNYRLKGQGSIWDVRLNGD
jgi:hypothetical protein